MTQVSTKIDVSSKRQGIYSQTMAVGGLRRRYCKLFAVVIFITVLSIRLGNDPTSISFVSTSNEATTFDTGTLIGSSQKELVKSITSSHTTKGNEDPCDGYIGVLLIDRGDVGAAATTLFFIYVVNYLIYAEMYNLLPWIHFNNVSHRVYDMVEHGGLGVRSEISLGDGSPRIITVKNMLTGLTIQHKEMGIKSCKKQQLAAPQNKTPLTEVSVAATVYGNGVWESYFEPVSHYSPISNPCKSPKPLVQFTPSDVASMHYRWPLAVKAWHYPDCFRPHPKRVVGGYHKWYEPQRKRGHEIVTKYFRLLPKLQELVEVANPTTVTTTALGQTRKSNCLAMHVRYTDKSGNRKKVPLEEYMPYAKAYLDGNFGDYIYLATDSGETMSTMKAKWPDIAAKPSRIRTQPATLLSNNETAVFDLVISHHRSNTEVLVDVYAMAKCNAFLHGRSAVSEAVIYLNFNMHFRSVDLEDPDKPTVQEFIESLRNA